MNRRDFLKQTMGAMTIVSGMGIGLWSCTRNLRSESITDGLLNKERDQNNLQIDPDSYKILHYASLAPSGHNSQPWFVRVISPSSWIIGSDKTRWLPQVDGSNREVMLSLGAFIENLTQAAGALGYSVQTSVIAESRSDEDIARISIFRSKQSDADHIALRRMISRRTVKSNMLKKELFSSDVNDFKDAADGNLHYFPSGTAHSGYMADEAVNNFIVQFENEKAMIEAADWTRLKDDEILKHRDGLTVDGMEITGFAGFYVRNMMNKTSLMGKTFKEKGIEKIKEQVRQGAGWIVITSSGNDVKSLIEAGRRFQRVALIAREKMIAIHPMTQTLEEKQGQKNIKENHSESMIPQFMLRVGYLNQYPDPVSLRRPVEWFVRHSANI